ncbi:MAG: hypothetical protein FWD85_11855, partial [Microbacteriaceae bacterium]|nr:hypothetical protein [Microbacteriaceae bacterium]
KTMPGVLALTMCTLLSSQGPPAPEFNPPQTVNLAPRQLVYLSSSSRSHQIGVGLKGLKIVPLEAGELFRSAAPLG